MLIFSIHPRFFMVNTTLLVFFYLSKQLFSGFLQFKGNFVRGQNTMTERFDYSYDYPIVTFWSAPAAFQSSLVEPLLVCTKRSLAKIPVARPNERDVPPKRTKKIRLGIYNTQIQPSDHDIAGISSMAGQWLDFARYRNSDTASDWLIANWGKA